MLLNGCQQKEQEAEARAVATSENYVTFVSTGAESQVINVYADGVWNVDDEGTYGIPDVVSIALDPDGYATIFLAKNSPESINCFALHQVGDKFEVIDFDQWYRFIDI